MTLRLDQFARVVLIFDELRSGLMFYALRERRLLYGLRRGLDKSVLNRPLQHRRKPRREFASRTNGSWPMTTGRRARFALAVATMLMSVTATLTKAQSQPTAYGSDPPNVFDGVLSNVAGSSEISTARLRAALNDGSAIILDARPYEEYAVSHIPGARAVPAKAGTTPALYVGDAAEVAKTVPDKTQPLILYCNGLFCGRSERLADDLVKLGYQNVRRYQLGPPGWRALGGVMQVEKPALPRLLAQDG